MSAYMIDNKTRAIIATYLAEALNASQRMGTVQGIKKIQLCSTDIMDVQELKACRAKNGDFSAKAIYKALYNLNRAAIFGRYGDKEAEKMVEPLRAMPKVTIDTREETRKEWLANLYTVLQCFIYQCSEMPNVTSIRDEYNNWTHIKCPCLKALESWEHQMAASLANYIVDEVRGELCKRKKTWAMF